MLTGGELATAIAAVLAAAIAFGWVLHWLWIRLSNAAVSDTARLTEMVNRLHETDRAREAAERARDEAEGLLAAREAEMAEWLAGMQAQLDGAVEGREAQLIAELREARMDAETAMAGLGNARVRIMELERDLDAVRERPG